MFKKIYIEITNICNLNCHFCSPSERKKQSLTKEQFNHIINEIKPHCKHVYFHVKGEPLLHENLEEFINICSSNNILVDITTNGTLLKQKQDIFFNSPVRQINVSIHADKGEKYLRDVCDFSKEITKQTKTVVVLRLWVNENNDIKQFLIKEFEIEKIDRVRSTKLKNNVYLSQASQFDWPSLDMPHISNRGFCYGMRAQVAILVDGTVVPCCLDSEGVINLGNIFKTSFNDIINSERAKNIAQNFSRRLAKEELCRKCTFKERFTKGDIDVN